MKTILKLFLITMASMSLAGLNFAATEVNSTRPAGVDELKLLRKFISQKITGKERLRKFDELDFEVFNGENWEDMKLSHAKDIKVTWPDGRVTIGIETHIEDLKGMFTWSPTTKVESHPVRIAAGEWTAVIGILTGRFSRVMNTPTGDQIQPTGKSFKIQMATIGRWSKGVMVEEFLFWDNKHLFSQIGL